MRTKIPAEAQRGCGFRKIGGLYLVCRDGLPFPCELMPYPLDLCPCCGEGIKFGRGIQWLDSSFFSKRVEGCPEIQNCKVYPNNCPFSAVKIDIGNRENAIVPAPKKGLMWVGEQFYPTPQDFIRESRSLGISKRISSVPKDLVLGESWILLAHRKVMQSVDVCPEDGPHTKLTPGIFFAFQPTAIEMVFAEGMVTDEQKERCAARNITPVEVPDIARHRGTAANPEKD